MKTEPKLTEHEKSYLIDTNELRVHPFNTKIYRDHPDETLDEDIKSEGIRVPLIVNKEYKILDGNRRHIRATKFGLKKIPIIIRFYEDEELAIVMLNKYRQKSPREQFLESQVLERKYQALYKVGRPSKEDKEKLIRKPYEFPQMVDKVASDLGMARGKLYQLKSVYENEDKIPAIVEALDNGTISVYKAAQAATLVLDEGADEKKVLSQALRSSIEVPRPDKKSLPKPKARKYFKIKCPACNEFLMADKKVSLVTLQEAIDEKRESKR